MVFANPNLFQTDESKLEEERRKRNEYFARLGLEQPSPTPAQELLSQQVAPPTTSPRFGNYQSPGFSAPVEFAQGGPQRMSRIAPPVRQEKKEEGFGEKLLDAATNILPAAAGAVSEFFLPGSGAPVKAAGDTIVSAAKGEPEKIPGNLLKTGGKELLKRAGASKSPEEEVAESAAKKAEEVADEGLTKLADNLGPTTAEQNIARDRVRKLTTEMMYLDDDQTKQLTSELSPVGIRDYGAFKRAAKYFESPGLARRALRENAIGEATAQNLAAMGRAALAEYNQYKTGDLAGPTQRLDAGFGAGQFSPFLGRVDLSPDARIYYEELAALDPTQYRSSDFSPVTPRFTSANVPLIDEPEVEKLAGPDTFLNEEAVAKAISDAIGASGRLEKEFTPGPAVNNLVTIPTPSFNAPTMSQFNAGQLFMQDPQVQDILARLKAENQMLQMGLDPVMQGRPQSPMTFDFSPETPLPPDAQRFLDLDMTGDLGALNEAVFQATQDIPRESPGFTAFSGSNPDLPPLQTVGAAQNLGESDMYKTMQAASNPNNVQGNMLNQAANVSQRQMRPAEGALRSGRFGEERGMPMQSSMVVPGQVTTNIDVRPPLMDLSKMAGPSQMQPQPISSSDPLYDFPSNIMATLTGLGYVPGTPEFDQAFVTLLNNPQSNLVALQGR